MAENFTEAWLGRLDIFIRFGGLSASSSLFSFLVIDIYTLRHIVYIFDSGRHVIRSLGGRQENNSFGLYYSNAADLDVFHLSLRHLFSLGLSTASQTRDRYE